MLMFASAFRAFTFDDEGYGVGEESLRQLDAWDMDVFHAEGSLARFAIEVDVSIVVVAFSLFLAEFIVEDALPVLEGVYHVVLQEESERPKDARLVHRHHFSFQSAEALRCLGFSQSLHHKDAVGSGLDALAFQFADNILRFHLIIYYKCDAKLRIISLTDKYFASYFQRNNHCLRVASVGIGIRMSVSRVLDIGS